MFYKIIQDKIMPVQNKDGAEPRKLVTVKPFRIDVHSGQYHHHHHNYHHHPIIITVIIVNVIYIVIIIILIITTMTIIASLLPSTNSSSPLSSYHHHCHHAVTNAQFMEFVLSTNYPSEAELYRWSFVFEGRR